MKYYLASYDKNTGDEVNTQSITFAEYQKVLIAMGIANYADGHLITPIGLSHLRELQYKVQPDLYIYQLEVCQD